MGLNIFWLVCIIIIAYSVQQTISILKYTYAVKREDYAFKVFMSNDTYPNFYTKFGKFPTKYLNTCYKNNSNNKNGKIMPLALRDFHIAAAYRPYQIAGQTYDICSYKSIKTVLKRGARFHFLDIWSSNPTNIYDDTAYPIVRNKTLMPGEYGNALTFKKVCEIYKKYSWVDTNYPLILYLNLHFTAAKNRFILAKIANILFSNFKGNFIGAEYSFAKKNIGEIPIKNTLKKIIILTNIYPSDGYLQELTNGVIGKNIENAGKITVFNEGNLTHGGIKAKTSDLQSIIDYNKTHLGIVIPGDMKNIANVYQPGVDLLQIPAIKPMEKYGFQIVCLNYQKPGKERDDYINFFKKSSLILKEDAVRYIPCPKPVINKQHNKASYAPRKINFKDGYFTHNF